MYLSVVVLSVLLGCANCLQLENFYNYLRDNDNGSSVDCEVQKAAFLEGLNNGDSWAAKSKKNKLKIAKRKKVRRVVYIGFVGLIRKAIDRYTEYFLRFTTLTAYFIKQ